MRRLALLLLASTCVLSQTTTTPTLTVAELANAAKIYLRDSAEFPLDMHLTMSAVSTSGRVIKADTAEGRYDFHGYNPRSEHGAASFRVTTKGMFHSAKPMVAPARNSFLAAILPNTVLFKSAADRYSLEMVPSPNPLLLTARVLPHSPCTEFKWAGEYNAPETICGSSEFQLQKDDLSLRHFSFEAGALPVLADVKPFGKCQLRRYHLEADFQRVTLPNDPKPFLVPAHVDVTVETDKGRLRMTTDFEPHK